MKTKENTTQKKNDTRVEIRVKVDGCRALEVV